VWEALLALCVVAAWQVARANTGLGNTTLLNRLFAEPGAATSVVGQQAYRTERKECAPQA